MLRVREIRQGHMMTLEQLADKVGVSVPYLQRLETGKRRLNVDLLVKIAAALDCAPQDLFDEYDVLSSLTNRDATENVRVDTDLLTGEFRHPQVFSEFHGFTIRIPKDLRFPGEKKSGYVLRDKTMEQTFRLGSVLVCVDIPDQTLRDAVPIQSGQHVIVTRYDPEGLTSETTVRELWYDTRTGKRWLMARPYPITAEWQQDIVQIYDHEPRRPEDYMNRMRISSLVIGAYMPL